MDLDLQGAFGDETALVARQYTAYRYPKPVEDLNGWIAAGNRDSFDIELLGPLYWPARANYEGLCILIAGCGTNQAAYFAYRNPTCQVVGIDLSEASLAHEKFLKEKHALSNLRLLHGSLLDVGRLGETFDLVVSTGVLHHLPDPHAGLQALRAVLRAEGAIGLMVYGQTLRTGVYAMQEAFRLMGVPQDTAGVECVKEVLAQLPDRHPVVAYTRKASETDLSYDAGLVDTFLHPVDRAYTVPELMAFLRDNGLGFMTWTEPMKYLLACNLPAGHPALGCAGKLRLEEEARLVELLKWHLGKHLVICGHPTYAERYRLNSRHPQLMRWIPNVNPCARALQAGLEQPMVIKLGGYELSVPPKLAGLLRAVDGKCSFEQIRAAVSPMVNEPEAHAFFADLVRYGILHARRI